MKILLIYPYCLEQRPYGDDATVVPIGVYYVGAVLMDHGYPVEILNWHDIHKTHERIEETLVRERPDLIGFSVLHANRWGALEIASIAKRLIPDVRIVFGGPGATFLWEHLLRHFPVVDYVVLGEGEYPFLNLVKALERGDGEEGLKAIEGIAYREADRPIRTQSPAPIEDLDTLPIPARYFTYQHVASSRGCPYDCSFCGSPKIWGRRVRFHSPEYFVRQLELLYDKGVRFFFFSDDTFTIQPKRVIEICKKILDRMLKITWVAISHVTAVNEDMLAWMRKAGCIQISYGVESGSERIRKALNKGITNQEIKKAFSLTTRYGILARAYFIYGSPGETEETIDETMALIHDIKPLSTIFYILDIFPGTTLYDDFLRRSRATDEIWLKRVEDIMYFETDPRLNSEKILAFGARLRKGYHESLPGFAELMDLKDQKDLYPLHADFLSRLAMTFSHGEYAGIEAIPGKRALAQRLFERALQYAPDSRAFLGLGMIFQQASDFEASVHILREGLRHFPRDESMHLCLGISLMNLGRYKEALAAFDAVPGSPEAERYREICKNSQG